MMMDGQHHAMAALPLGMGPSIHLKGGWVGPRAHLDRSGKSRLHPVSKLKPSNP